MIRLVKMALCAAFIAGAFPLFGQAPGPADGGAEIAGFPAFRSNRSHLLPPVIDGVITDGLPQGVRPDTGWRAASRIVLANGVTVPDVAFQGLKEEKGDFLDMSFEVRHDPSLDEGDAVVVGLRPLQGDASAGFQVNDLVIIVYPFAGKDGTAAVPAGGTPSRVEIWKYLGDGWRDVSAEVKGCRWAARAFAATDDSFGWDLECRIPAGTAAGGDAWVDLPDRFSLYWNVVRVQSGPMPSVSQFFWPRHGKPLAGSLAPDALSAVDWGLANKFEAGVHKGLWIDPTGITVSPLKPSETPDDFKISLDAFLPSVHTFTAVVKNDAERITGNFEDYTDVPDVRVDFRSADWGIPGANPGPDWIPLQEIFTPERGSVNPTKPQTIRRAQNPTEPGSTPFIYKSAIGPQIPSGITTIDRRCLYAEISAPAGTYFREPGTYRNMIVSAAPEFEDQAVLSVRGYGRPPGGKEKFTYLLRSEKKTWVARKGDAYRSGPEVLTADDIGKEVVSDINSYLEWTFHGFLITGDTLTVRGRQFTVALPTGSFGYRIRRPTEVRAWHTSLRGAELLGGTTYQLQIAADGAAEMTTGLRTEEATGLFLGVRAGVAVPASFYAGDYILGPSTCVEVGLKATQLLSAFLDVGYNFLFEPTGGNGFNVFYAMLGIRAVLELSPAVYMYLQGGLFGYTPNFNMFDLGIDVGLGAGLALTDILSLEAQFSFILGSLSGNKGTLVFPGIGLIVRF